MMKKLFGGLSFGISFFLINILVVEIAADEENDGPAWLDASDKRHIGPALNSLFMSKRPLPGFMFYHYGDKRGSPASEWWSGPTDEDAEEVEKRRLGSALQSRYKGMLYRGEGWKRHGLGMRAGKRAAELLPDVDLLEEKRRLGAAYNSYKSTGPWTQDNEEKRGLGSAMKWRNFRNGRRNKRESDSEEYELIENTDGVDDEDEKRRLGSALNHGYRNNGKRGGALIDDWLAQQLAYPDEEKRHLGAAMALRHGEKKRDQSDVDIETEAKRHLGAARTFSRFNDGHDDEKRHLGSAMAFKSRYNDDKRHIGSALAFGRQDDKRHIGSALAFGKQDDKRPIGSSMAFGIQNDKRHIASALALGRQDEEKRHIGSALAFGKQDDKRHIGSALAFGRQDDKRHIGSALAFGNEEDKRHIGSALAFGRQDDKRHIGSALAFGNGEDKRHIGAAMAFRGNNQEEDKRHIGAVKALTQSKGEDEKRHLGSARAYGFGSDKRHMGAARKQWASILPSKREEVTEEAIDEDKRHIGSALRAGR